MLYTRCFLDASSMPFRCVIRKATLRPCCSIFPGPESSVAGGRGPVTYLQCPSLFAVCFTATRRSSASLDRRPGCPNEPGHGSFTIWAHCSKLLRHVHLDVQGQTDHVSSRHLRVSLAFFCVSVSLSLLPMRLIAGAHRIERTLRVYVYGICAYIKKPTLQELNITAAAGALYGVASLRTVALTLSEYIRICTLHVRSAANCRCPPFALSPCAWKRKARSATMLLVALPVCCSWQLLLPWLHARLPICNVLSICTIKIFNSAGLPIPHLHHGRP